MTAEETRRPTNLALALLSVTALVGSMVIANDMSTFPASGYAMAVLSAVGSSAGLAAVAGSTFLKIVKARSPANPRTMSVAWLAAAGASSCCGLLIAVLSDPLHALLVACVTAVNVGVAIGIAIKASFGRKLW